MSTETLWLIGIVAGVAFIIAFILLAQYVHHFMSELRRLNNEIRRTHGAERESYRRRRRRLWLSLIPFIRY